MRFKTRLKMTHNLIDLTPLVDVIFLMLIFFLITSDTLPLKSLMIENPELEKNSAPLTTQLLVVMDAERVIYVGSKKAIVPIDGVKEQLTEELKLHQIENPGAEPRVVLSIDRRVPYGDFLPLFSICQECSNKLRLVFRPAENQSEI
jgi:biopolymer transport protein ExbD